MGNNNIPWKKMSCSRNFGVSPVSRHFLLKKISRNMRNNNIPWKKCLDQGILSFFLFLELLIAKNVKKHEKQQSPLNKWLSQGFLSFLLFLDTFEYNKMSRNRRNDKISWESHLFKGLCCFSCFLTFSSRAPKIWLFPDTFEKLKCLETGKRQNPLNTESVQKQG